MLRKPIKQSQDELRELQIKDLKNKWKWFRGGALVSIVAALIGILPIIIEKARNQPQEIHIEFPKMVLIHDTVFVKKIDTLKH